MGGHNDEESLQPCAHPLKGRSESQLAPRLGQPSECLFQKATVTENVVRDDFLEGAGQWLPF